MIFVSAAIFRLSPEFFKGVAFFFPYKEVWEICEPISEQVSCAQALLNDPLDLTMSKVDFEYCRNELKKSLNSTGQTSNILNNRECR